MRGLFVRVALRSHPTFVAGHITACDIESYCGAAGCFLLVDEVSKAWVSNHAARGCSSVATPRRSISMSGLRAPSAIIAVMLAATAPLLAACDQPDSAVASTASQPAEPDVSIVAVKPQPRALLRELPGRIAPIRV